MVQPHLLQDEINLLYIASNKLTQASTPIEQLEAVSDYPRSNGAIRGVLLYLDDTCCTEEVVAEWTMGQIGPFGIGPQLPVSHFGFARLTTPARPTFVQDLLHDERVDPATLAIAQRYNMRAAIILPLYNKGRWVAEMLFVWGEPRLFDERDLRVYTALQQHAAPVVDSARLFEQTQKRAAELEIAKREMDILYDASSQLTRASTLPELLEAVSAYPREIGAYNGQIYYLSDHLHQMETVVTWGAIPERQLPVGFTVKLEGRPFSRYWLARPHSPTLVSDVMSDERVDAGSREIFARLHTRGLALLPLYTNGRWIGVISFYWNTPYVFDERDERLFTTLQHQLAPAMDSLRLFEQSQQRAVLAEKLARVNAALSQATDEQSILNAVSGLVEGLNVGGASLAYSVIGDAGQIEEIEWVALQSSGGDAAPLEALPVIIFRLKDYPHIQMAFDYPDEPIFVEDLENEPREQFARLRMDEETRHWRAFVVVPLLTGDQWQGLLNFYWKEPRSFTPEVRAIFAAIMPSAASVVTSRRAYLAEQEAREESELLYRASRGINNATTASEIVAAVEQLNLRSLHISLAVWEKYNRNQATYLEIIAASPESTWPVGMRLSIQEVPLGYDTIHTSLVVVEDTLDDNQIDEISAATVERQGYRAFMLVHLLLASRCIGHLAFGSTSPRAFTTRENRLALGIGDLVTAALERIRLHEETEAALQRAEALAEQAQRLASLEERTRLARELHDSVSQALYGIGLGARTARALYKRDPARLNEPLDYILSLTEAGLTEMRALIFELRPESLEQEGLTTALSKQAASLQARHGIQVETEFCEEPRLPLDVKEGLYRIAREALHNTVKHARASQVKLSLLHNEKNGYRLEIADNGLGFDTSQDFPGHLGLKSMRERTAALNGSLHIESTPGNGTHIIIIIACDDLSSQNKTV